MTPRSSSPSGRAEVKACWLTGPGRARDHNEDCLLVLQQVSTENGSLPNQEHDGCLAVFDGMGGHRGGEIASRAAADFLSAWTDWSLSGTRKVLQDANRRLFELANSNSDWHAMGATVAGLAFGSEGLLVFNVGDARVYKFSGGFLQPLTKDDSLHQVLLDAGQSSGERSQAQHAVLQSLGGRSDFTEIEPHVHLVRLKHPSRFMICSDGITDMLNADNLEAAVANRASCEECAKALYEAAIEAGGKDNLSVIVADIQPAISI